MGADSIAARTGLNPSNSSTVPKFLSTKAICGRLVWCLRELVTGEGRLGTGPVVRTDIEWEVNVWSVNGDSDQGVSVDVFRSVNTEGAKTGEEWIEEGGESHIEPA
jgi:hypothetical protein